MNPQNESSVRDNFVEILGIISGIFLTLPIESVYNVISTQGLSTLGFPYLLNFALPIYALTIIWLVYALLLYRTKPHFEVNPLHFIVFPAVPILFIAKQLGGWRRDEPYRPTIDICFMFTFLLTALAIQLDANAIQKQVTTDYVPYTLIAVTGMGILLLYIALDDWRKIKTDKNIVWSLGAVGLFALAITVYALFSSKPVFMWNQWIRYGIFVPYGILIIAWLLKVNKEARFIRLLKLERSSKKKE